MADAIFILIILAFFGAGAGLVVLCDRVIGPGEEATRTDAEPTPVEELAA